MARATAGTGRGSTGSPNSVTSTLTSGTLSLSGTFERGRRDANFINMVADVYSYSCGEAAKGEAIGVNVEGGEERGAESQ